ncbi:MAG TPA: HD domain-containing phosphohydrolase [Candidatus Deferrimicrobiaceae bacterium]|jgi:putative nucleotidyltransferase with HDIG domain
MSQPIDRHPASPSPFFRPPGIRVKLVGFLMPLIVLLVAGMAVAVMTITNHSVRADLLQRGVAASRIVALSARWSLMSGDNAAVYNLAVETRRSAPDIEYVAIIDTAGRIIGHNDPRELGHPFRPSTRVAQLGGFVETQADDVQRDGKDLIEFSTAILHRGVKIGLVSIGFSKQTLVDAQRKVRNSITAVALGVLALALLGAMALSSLITTPIKRLTAAIKVISVGKTFHRIPVTSSDEFGELLRSFNRMAVTILSQQDRLKGYASQLEAAYLGMVRVVAASIEARDPYTIGHSTRVAQLSCALGKRLGMGEEELGHLEKAALFHDVGKIGMPDEVLLKEERLSMGELDVMRRHPIEGAAILGMAPFLDRYVAIVGAHHEWYDGTGYPYGRKDSEIPVHAQIIALADAYDAMTTTRPYRQALTNDQAIESLREYRGTQFSPVLTDLFVKLLIESPPVPEPDWKGMAL